MSTSYGDFEDRNGHKVYINASQIHHDIEFCGDDDTQVLMRFDQENATHLANMLFMAFLHNGWEWPAK